jgi:hypothetical protein
LTQWARAKLIKIKVPAISRIHLSNVIKNLNSHRIRFLDARASQLFPTTKHTNHAKQ